MRRCRCEGRSEQFETQVTPKPLWGRKERSDRSHQGRGGSTFSPPPGWGRVRVGVAKVVETSILLARSLRRVQTDAERLLWRHLQSKQMEGFKFRRQAPIGKYVVDFVSFARKLIVEVDGGQHAVEIAKDQKRENWLFTQGFTTVRFWNNAVLQNLEGVLEAIRESILKI